MIKPNNRASPEGKQADLATRRGCMVFHCRMLIMPYGTARSSRNADFIIRGEAATTTLGAEGPIHLKNLPL